jgi:hypothetical protein
MVEFQKVDWLQVAAPHPEAIWMESVVDVLESFSVYHGIH